MAATLQTLNHGEIEGGFYFGFTKIIYLGDYNFATKYFFDLIIDLANNPVARKGRLMSYNHDQFEDMFRDYTKDIFGTTHKAMIDIRARYRAGERLGPNELLRALQVPIDEAFERQKELLLEDKIKALTGEEVPVDISPTGTNISFGKYSVRSEDFVFFVGWNASAYDNDFTDRGFFNKMKPILERSGNPLFIEGYKNRSKK